MFMTKEKIQLKNWALSIVIKRALFGHKTRKIIPWKIRYSKIFDRDFDAEKYVLNKRMKWNKIIDTIIKHSPKKGKVLEAGCGTSALAIWLGNNGFNTFALDTDSEILRIASTLNKKTNSRVRYKKGSLVKIPFKDQTFDIIFSHGSLEHFNTKEIQEAINEGLRVADKYVFGVPTIFDVSNCLRGDEFLTTYFQWKKIISRSEGYIIDSYASFPFHRILEKINLFFGSKLTWISPTIIFVVKSKK